MYPKCNNFHLLKSGSLGHCDGFCYFFNMAVGQRLVEKGRGEVAFVSGRDYANAGFNWCLHPDLALHGEL